MSDLFAGLPEPAGAVVVDLERAAGRDALPPSMPPQEPEPRTPAERLDVAEQRAQTAELAILRADVAAAYGIPANLTSRLMGTTREELEADAAALLEQVGLPGPPPAPGTSGRPPAPPAAGGPPPPSGPEAQFIAMLNNTYGGW